MPADDLDLDLDLDSESAPVRKAPAPAAPGKPTQDAAKPADAAPAGVPTKRPGILQRLCAPCKAFFGRFHLPPWNLKTFLIGLAVLVLLLVIVENWPPMRLSLLGLHADIPKAVVLAVVFALGYLVAWIGMRKPRPAEGGEG